MADIAGQANVNQLIQLRVHGDQIDAEGFGGQRLGGLDLRLQQVGCHGAARDHAETTRVGDTGNQISL